LKVEVIVQIGDSQNFRQIESDIASLNREDRHVDGLLNIASIVPFTLWFYTVHHNGILEELFTFICRVEVITLRM
jgi:hypothetical protein